MTRFPIAALLAAAPFAALLPGSAAAGERPVVVELFTSEGCSSCPPAERYLNDLARRPGVLPLAFHVTYWDRLGWKDLYSLDAATARQAVYGVRFGDGSYTPEMVVDGAKALVGSDRGAGEAAIAAAQEAASAAQGGAEGVGAALSVARDAEGVSIRVGAGRGRGRVVLIGFDPEHSTPIRRGENTGRTVTESNVVRSVRVVGDWAGAATEIRAPVPAGEDCAVLLESPDGHVVGAARATS